MLVSPIYTTLNRKFYTARKAKPDPRKGKRIISNAEAIELITAERAKARAAKPVNELTPEELQAELQAARELRAKLSAERTSALAGLNQ